MPLTLSLTAAATEYSIKHRSMMQRESETEGGGTEGERHHTEGETATYWETSTNRKRRHTI